MKRAWAGLLLAVSLAAGVWAKLSDIQNVQVVVDGATVSSPEDVREAVLELFREEAPGVKASPELADVKFHVQLAETLLDGKEGVAYNHRVHLCGSGTDKYGTFEKVYWERTESGVAGAGKYPKVVRKNLKRAVKEFSGSSDEAEQFSAQVIGVLDGDTLSVLDQRDAQSFRTIRLHAVDCPEKTQRFGPEAREFTTGLVQGKTVTVKVASVDRYGRVLGDVTMSNGKSLSQELVRAGMAWWYNKYSDDSVLARLEEEAEDAGRGLWADREPTPPWEYRKESDDMPFKSKKKP